MTNFVQTLEENPLLHGLPMDIERAEWWKRMTCDPFKGEDIMAMNAFRRDLLLDRFCEMYVPTQATTDIAYELHRMLINGLIDRNPYRADQRRAIYQIASWAHRGKLDIPYITASPRGMLLKGVTKQGKTRLLKRFLSQLPQVLSRKEDQRAGWLELDQLVYLVIPMPTDASKAGFLMQAFIELDNALGTSYARDATIRNSTIDVQLVQLLAKLALHRCGLLVIEEAQESNELSKSRFGRDFHTFFLRVLNTGIPTVLVGNPMAFEELRTSSQLMSRLTDPGQFILSPSTSGSSPEWVKDLVPKLWGKNPLPEPDEPFVDREEFLWKATGGFTHYLSVLRRESLRAAVNAGSRWVTKKHIDDALRTPVMLEGREIFQSYWSGINSGEVNYVDVPGIPNPRVISVTGKRRR